MTTPPSRCLTQDAKNSESPVPADSLILMQSDAGWQHTVEERGRAVIQELHSSCRRSIRQLARNRHREDATYSRGHIGDWDDGVLQETWRAQVLFIPSCWRAHWEQRMPQSKVERWSWRGFLTAATSVSGSKHPCLICLEHDLFPYLILVTSIPRTASSCLSATLVVGVPSASQGWCSQPVPLPWGLGTHSPGFSAHSPLWVVLCVSPKGTLCLNPQFPAPLPPPQASPDSPFPEQTRHTSSYRN